jgi:hypothetical protein
VLLIESLTRAVDVDSIGLEICRVLNLMIAYMLLLADWTPRWLGNNELITRI